MASSYVNDLRLEEIADGEQSGTWGATTNTNLELIGEALGFGTQAITTNADTFASTVADGAADAERAMYIKYTGTLDSACTITIGPNTISRMHFIENGTSGSQNIIISQGSGANVTIPPGDTKAVYLDGAGSGAAVVDAFATLNVVDLKVQDDLTVTDDATIGGTLGVTGVVTANAGVVVDEMTLDGDTLTATDTFTIDAVDDITLDAASTLVRIKHNGTQRFIFNTDATPEIDALGGNFTLHANTSDADIIFTGNDGGAAITALTLDMSDGGTAIFNKNADFGDGSGIRLGAGNDLQLYHDGSNSYIDETGTGSLIIKSNRTRIQSDDGENQIEALANGAVELYFDTAKKIETSATGVTITGNAVATAAGAADAPNFAITSGSLGVNGMFTPSANRLAFTTSSTERVRIDESGNVLVGKTTDAFGTAGTVQRANGISNFTVNGNSSLNVNRLSSDGTQIAFHKDSTTVGGIGTNSGGLFVMSLLTNDSGLFFGTNVINPCTTDGNNRDDVIDLGFANARFDDIFATNNAIQTSDRNEKQDIAELSDAETRVAVVAKGLMRKYRWKKAVAEKGDNARTHFGIIAQDLQDAFAAESLDASDYAMFCSDTWWEKEISVDAVEADEANGEEAKDAYTYMDTKDEATDGYTEKTRLGVRYSELLAFIISAI